MKSCLFLIGLVCVVSPLAADEPQAPASMDAMMKQMMEFGAPTDEHQVLTKLAGKWKCEITEYPMFPGMKVTVSKGEAEFESEFGGRFVEQEFKSDYNGMEYEGEGVMGYDKGKGVFFSTWRDNMSTHCMYAEGNYDKDSKTITQTCTIHSPLGKMDHKMVTKIKSNDEMVMEMYGRLPEQPEMKKMMRIVYTRRQ